MKKLISYSIFILCVFSFKAYAAGGWSQKGNIIEVYNFGWSIHVRMSGTAVDYSEGGACSDTYYYALDASSNTHYDSMVSQILMAHASGANTIFWIDGSDCQGQNNNKQKIVTIRTFK